MATENERILITAYVPTGITYPLPACGFAHVAPSTVRAVTGGAVHYNYFDPSVVGPADAPPPAGVVEERVRMVYALLAPAEVYPTPDIGFAHRPPSINHPVPSGSIEINFFDFDTVVAPPSSAVTNLGVPVTHVGEPVTNT